MQRIRDRIRAIADFPEAGVVFRDISPLLRDPVALRLAVHQLLHPFLGRRITAVAGMEARGFIFGSLVAWELSVAFVPLRKPGKLPPATDRADYRLEYGFASLEMHLDALDADDRVLIVDDVLATGGTASASCELVERRSAEVAGLSFLIELSGLGGRAVLNGRKIHSVLIYD
jgi:adenine phosphoribosyltransferase